MYKYNWFWRKNRKGGFINAKLKPLKVIEEICVFSKGKTSNGNKNNMEYYPQGLVKCDKVTSIRANSIYIILIPSLLSIYYSSSSQ